MATRHRGPVAFDLDGVLIDSRTAVEKAYQLAGVEMPVHAWGKAAHEWLADTGLNAKVIHERKQRLYPQALRLYARVLSGANVLRTLKAAGYSCMIVTSASILSAMDALEYIDLMGQAEVFAGLQRDKKPGLLERHGAVCYVDDDPPFECSVPYVRYVDDEATLYSQIRRYL